MTIIVASRTGIIADMQVTDGDNDICYHANKIIRWKGELIAAAGNNTGIEQFLRWYRGRRTGKLAVEGEGNSFDAVVVNKRGMFAYCDCSLPDEITDEYYCLGTGAIAAKAAMLAGADPRRAVEITCEVVNSCGPPIQEEVL